MGLAQFLENTGVLEAKRFGLVKVLPKRNNCFDFRFSLRTFATQNSE